MSAAALHPQCDRASAHAAAAGPAVARPGMVLAVCIMASSLAFIDGSVVNVGLPSIGRSFGGRGDLSWVVDAYLLPLSALLLVGGAAGDLYGRRRLLTLGVGLFAAASALCAVAPSLAVLLAGRLLQGVGAAMLMPNSLAILGATFTGEARGRAIGTWAAVGAGAGAVGPLLGGWLVDAVGWRAVFYINLPVAAAAIWLARRYVPGGAAGHGRLDVPGAVLAAGGLASLTWGMTVASAARTFGGAAAAAVAAGLALLAGFVWHEGRRGSGAMMPLALFRSRPFVGLTLLTFLLYGALGGLLVLVPFVLIEARGYSATAAGAALLPLPLVIAALSSRMGRLAGRIGPRLPLTIGPLVAAAGCVLAARIGGAGSYWTTVLPALLVISLGVAGSAAPLTTAVLSSVSADHTGVASGLNSAVARSGGLMVTALASLVIAADRAELVPLFQLAALAGAALAAAAGGVAFATLRQGAPAKAAA